MSNLGLECICKDRPAEDDRAAILRHAPCAMVVLALVGLAVAVYDSYMIHRGLPLWCPPPIEGCNEVAASPYARILGLPVGYYGIVFYLYMFGFAVLLAFDPNSPGLRLGAVLYTAMGLLFSLYFIVLQVVFIRAFCIYCLVSAVTTLLLSAAAVVHLNTACASATASAADKHTM
jgi:uncharacterized membrane protein